MTLQLPNSLASSQDLQAAILEIQGYAKWYGQTLVKLHKSNHKGYAAPAISPAAVELVEQWQGDKPITQPSLDRLIEALEELVSSAPRLTITLAAPAPGSLKQELLAWCRQNIGPNTLLDLKFNGTLLGGMVVRYGSHIYDWSFKRQILAARAKFPEVLRGV